MKLINHFNVFILFYIFLMNMVEFTDSLLSHLAVFEKINSELYLKLDSCVAGLLGTIAFLCPSLALSIFLNVDTDGVHWHLARVLGAVLIGQSFTWWHLSQSKHYNTHLACLLTRIVMSTLIIIATVHARTFFFKYFTYYAISLIFLTNGCVIVLSVVQLIRIRCPFGHLLAHPKELIFNCLLQADAFCALVIGITWFAFPDWILSRQVTSGLVETHRWLGRCFGATLLSLHVLSNQFIYFQKPEDRRAWSYGHTLINGGILLAQIYSQFFYHTWWTGHHWVGAGLFSIWSVVVFYCTYALHNGIFH